MNLPTPSQRFNKQESGLDTATGTVATASMQIASKEANDVSGYSDIPVAIHGTWQKHGHTSLNGAVIATSFYTGKVLDASILSRFCKCPNKMHNENYKANHFGNSGSMYLKTGMCYLCRETDEDSATSFKTKNERTATAGLNVVQSGRPIFDDFFQHLWPYIGYNTANVVFQIVKRLWLIRIHQ
ncbi:uncharacterized protein TNCV_1004841 [Trichonephila clavipes]|nr:uncharacterized protein TNCV_1004841 [Trichonephila clavipes]